MDELYQRIIESYNVTGSVKKTADDLGTYPIKVRRVLLTEGLWHSKTSDQIAEMQSQGINTAEIAEKLSMSVKTVQSYMPYTRGQYGGENRSSDAIRSEEYRERMQTAAQNQVTKTEALSKQKEEELKEQRRLYEELMAEKERLLKETKELFDSIEADLKSVPLALQLHLELGLGFFPEENKEVLRRYGRMQDGITRDFIVPGTMTLHGLHYAIMKAFGWQNSHLHSFMPYKDEFKKMTRGMVREWTRQIGMYFHFPDDDYEDRYWDDDYEEDESIKSWLRSKYCGPYEYDGVGEHYLPAQLQTDQFRMECPEIQRKTTDQNTWGVYFEGRCEELLERLEIRKVLKAPADKTTWSEWKKKKEASLKEAEKGRREALLKYIEMTEKIDAIAEKAQAYFQKDEDITEEAASHILELYEYDEKIKRYCFEHDPETFPILSALRYQYDYGDGWEIRITCTNVWFDKSVYSRDETGQLHFGKNGFKAEKEIVVDAYGKLAEGEFLNKLKEIGIKKKPVCIAWDGMNLLDDVGGIDGFCDFLEMINGSDPELKKEYKNWAKSLGWTGRMAKPENIL